MGQRIHPHGLRVGTHRKWNATWFTSDKDWKNIFFYQKEVENFFKSIFYYYPYTKISKTKKILLFDVKIFKYGLNKLFLFIFFYKIRTKRRKDVRPIMSYKQKSKKKIYIKKKRNINRKFYSKGMWGKMELKKGKDSINKKKSLTLNSRFNLIKKKKKSLNNRKLNKLWYTNLWLIKNIIKNATKKNLS